MCGLIGILSPGGMADRQRLQRATNALAHRGPDGEGHWLAPDRTVGLGHRRLAIMDPEHGVQPFISDEGIIAIVNGEFYDDARIRQELESRGRRFATRSDSEILLHLYAEQGLDCLKHLRGEFAFIIYDTRSKQLIAGRDRFGIKPLCYSVVGDEVMIASEAKALFAAGLEAKWDSDAFAHVSCFQYTAPNQTLFRGVQQLPPGHLLIATQGDVRLQKYWDMDFPTGACDDATPQQVLEALSESIALRLRTDGARVCCHLSGGVDSASIAALASASAGRPLPCFTVGFAHDAYDERHLAERMAASIGAEFHLVDASADDLIDHLSDAVYFSEGLAINSHLPAKYLLNRAIARAGFKVALSGEGSDELFAGYPHFKLDKDASPKEVFAENMVSAGVQIARGETLPVEAFEQVLGYVPGFVRAKAGIGLKLRALMRDDFVAAHPASDIYAALLRALPVQEQLQGRSPIHQSTYLWCKYALANYILRTLGDGCEMAHSIEGRVPFLDHHLFALARSIPNAQKIVGGVEKHILREAVKPYVTPEIVARGKHPFMAPPLSLLDNTRAQNYVQDRLRAASFAAMPFFDAKKVTTYLDTLPAMSVAEQIAAEPAIMLLLTSQALGERYGLSA